MRYAVIDNATLTGVQRLLGEVEVENTVAIDGDIAAFESLIQSILFYDTLFYVDDYKQEHRASRKATFTYLTGIPPTAIHYDEIAAAAATEMSDLKLSVTAGQIDRNIIGKFLEQLKLFSAFTWDMQSSNWFLTMKMLEGVGGLDIEKYAALHQMIFLELSSNASTIAPRVEGPRFYSLVGSDGSPIPRTREEDRISYSVRNQIYAFAASLNWLATRTCFYSYLPYQYEVDAILHPIRSAFQLSVADKLGLKSTVLSPVIRRLADETTKVVKAVKAPSDPIVAEMDLPLLSAWLVEKAGDPKLAIDLAFDLRYKSPVKEARQRLTELDELSKDLDASGFVKESNRLIAEVKSAGEVLKKSFYVDTGNGVSISPLIAIFNVLGKLKGLPSLPQVPVKVPVPSGLAEIGLRGGFRALCRSVVHDLTAVSRLGHAHEKLTSRVRFKHGRPATFLPKVEQARFLGRASHWKRPM